MKFFIILCLFIGCLLSMDNDPFPLESDNHPELEYFRLLEKINHVQTKINYIKYYTQNDPELIKDAEKLHGKLNRLQAKLQSHEND